MPRVTLDTPLRLLLRDDEGPPPPVIIYGGSQYACMWVETTTADQRRLEYRSFTQGVRSLITEAEPEPQEKVYKKGDNYHLYE